MEFEEFPKMARLTREVVITEKIDGTNAQVAIRELADDEAMPTDTPIVAVRGKLLIYAGSRSRWLLPNPGRVIGGVNYTDNFAFAQWVESNADELAKLGPGRHFGEWWGSGIQRGYGLEKGEKRFSLFNTSRWHEAGANPYLTQPGDPRMPVKSSTEAPVCCRVVPIIYRGLFHEVKADHMLERLRSEGSFAAPGFMNPEGVVVYHTASGTFFKKTLDKDEMPKSLVAQSA